MYAPRRRCVALLAYRGKPHVGGQGVYVRHLTKALVDLGHHVEVLRRSALPRGSTPGAAGRTAQPRHLQRPLPHACRGCGSSRTGPTRRGHAVLVRPVPRAAGVQPAGLAPASGRRHEFDLVHDNQCLGYGLLAIERDGLPVLGTIHHPITVDRRLELEHAELVQAADAAPLVLASPTCRPGWPGGKRARSPCRRTRSTDINADHGVDPDRMHIVPVGVDTELFRPGPTWRDARPDHHHRLGRRGP